MWSSGSPTRCTTARMTSGRHRGRQENRPSLFPEAPIKHGRKPSWVLPNRKPTERETGDCGCRFVVMAAATGISKSGLYAHFGSKQQLQLATVDEAERILAAEVVQPALAAPPGLAQLTAVCEAFFSYLQRRVFPGGCFFAATALEMGTHPGPVKERVAAIQSGFTALLRACAATALEQHELPAREDPDRLAFELHAILLGADTKFVLHDDPAILDLARQVVRQRLGLDNGRTAGES